MRVRPSILALAAALAATPALAQNGQPQPNDRVMLVLSPQRQVEGYVRPQELRGTLLAEDADSLTLQLHPGTGPVRVARGAVRRMYVSRGLPSRAQSAATGAVGGAIGGAIVGWLHSDDEPFGAHSEGQAALIGAGLGGGFGMVMGALFPRERWKRIRTPRTMTIAPAATAEGKGLALNIRI